MHHNERDGEREGREDKSDKQATQKDICVLNLVKQIPLNNSHCS